MQWSELSGPEVKKFAQTTDVAILPLGCIEMHGPHLPTGTDGIHAGAIANRAAQIEKAIVLPPLYYNINDEMKCYPGTISIPPRIMLELEEAICKEAARNGFKKIIIFVSHGGSEHVVDFLMHQLLENNAIAGVSKRSYTVFWVGWEVIAKAKKETFPDESPEDRHGGAAETSIIMSLRPDLVRKNKIGETGSYIPKKVKKAHYFVDWIRQVPEGFCGEPTKASKEKGERLINIFAQELAKVIRQVKGYNPEKDA